MKNLITKHASLLIIISILLLLAQACEEKSKGDSVKDLLTAVKWQIIDVCGPVTDGYTYTFRPNGQLLEENVQGVPDPTIYSSWVLKNNDNTLVIGASEEKIISLTKTVLKIKGPDLFDCVMEFHSLPLNTDLRSNGVSSITSTSATLHGKINTAHESASVSFEYGESPLYGQSTAADPPDALADNITDFSVALTGLSPGTIYYYRAKADVSSLNLYGKDLSFRTFNSETVTDIDNNIYHTITINDQVWMVENLKVVRFNDGSAIPLVESNLEWTKLSAPGYCWYDNNSSVYKETYGALYNWASVSSGKICPTGWHAPSKEEWEILTVSLGSDLESGGMLKEASISHWKSPNRGATNESGFTALPGGFRYFENGIFTSIGEFGGWWSSTSSDTLSWTIGLAYLSGSSGGLFYSQRAGYSVRCLKN